MEPIVDDTMEAVISDQVAGPFVSTNRFKGIK